MGFNSPFSVCWFSLNFINVARGYSLGGGVKAEVKIGLFAISPFLK